MKRGKSINDRKTFETDRQKGKLSLTCSIILFAAVLFFSVRGIRNLSMEYRAVLNLDLSADTGGYSGYDDNLYGSIRYGIEIDHRDSEKALRLLDFAESSLHATDRRIITCTLIYTMLISAAAAYWLYVESAGNRRKHLWSIFFAVLAVPAGLLAAVLIAHAALGLPFFFLLPANCLSYWSAFWPFWAETVSWDGCSVSFVSNGSQLLRRYLLSYCSLCRGQSLSPDCTARLKYLLSVTLPKRSSPGYMIKILKGKYITTKKRTILS